MQLSKYWQVQADVADRAEMIMSILTIASLFIDQIWNFFLLKWSAEKALQTLNAENILWEHYVLVVNYPW